MDYSEIKIKKLSDEEIAKIAADFRDKYHKDKPSPIDILDIVEFDLGMQIVPVNDLHRNASASVFITSTWDTMYIDAYEYSDERSDKRTNFSVAHEIGHYILHKEFYETLGINKLEDVYEFFEKVPPKQYAIVESQASKFAAKLLVPPAELRNEIEVLLAKAQNGEIEQIEIKQYLSDKFQVSQDVIFKSMIREEIKIEPEMLDGFA